MYQFVLHYDFIMRHKKLHIFSAVLISFDENFIILLEFLPKKIFAGTYAHLHFSPLQIRTCIFQYLHFYI